MIDLAEAYRVYLNACNLRDWQIVEQMLSPSLLVNNVEQTAAVYVKSLVDLIANRPDFHWVAEHVIVSELLPPQHSVLLVTVLDGHPHTLSFFGAARGDPTVCLGVSEFGRSSNLSDASALHHIDDTAIVDAALRALGR